ncbi:LSU ribosomal protein L11P methyltransferase [Candidatus Sulfopaludibacter sp. SbA3]|nr:LSU ribosomal protein L11P methyltransferase [Candidatus Sulfopaludibacter sp. SbA3]
MFSLEIECDPDDRDQGSAGMVELSPVRVRAFFEDGIDRDQLLQLYPGSTWREEEQRDWVQSARDLLQPMEVGERFFLVPEWRDDPAPAGRFRITVNPGMAFGTGVHETTRLCIEALERFTQPGAAVLDVGTGSGILAEAAKLLGAGRVYACDTDPVAVEIAGIGFVGSVNAIAAASMDVVVANISPEAIIQPRPSARPPPRRHAPGQRLRNPRRGASEGRASYSPRHPRKRRLGADCGVRGCSIPKPS